MKDLNKNILAIWLGGVMSGFVLGIIMAIVVHNSSLDAEANLQKRAIKARCAEWYVNDDRKLEFRFLTEHKDN